MNRNGRQKTPRNRTVRKGRRGGAPAGRRWWTPDPRPPAQILDEEIFLTKQMLAKVLGYRNVRSVDQIVEEDCASDAPCLRPIYLRRPRVSSGEKRPEGSPSFKSVRFRREDVFAYVEKMQEEFPADLEWRVGGGQEGGEAP